MFFWNSLAFSMIQRMLAMWSLVPMDTDTSTAERCFHFGADASSLLELSLTALRPSPAAYWTRSDLGGLVFWCYIFLPYHIVHGVLAARILEWFAIPFSSGRFARTLHYSPFISGGPARHGSDLTKLCKPFCHDKAVIMKGAGRYLLREKTSTIKY